MRSVSFVVSAQMIKDALHMPEDCVLINVNFDSFDEKLSFQVAIPGTYAKNEMVKTDEVIPIIHYEPEKWTWDWNLKEG